MNVGEKNPCPDVKLGTGYRLLLRKPILKCKNNDDVSERLIGMEVEAAEKGMVYRRI